MIIDSHCHIGDCVWSYPPGKFHVDELFERMQEASIDMACCFSFWDLLGNDYVYEATKKSDRLIPFALVNPSLPGAVSELERCLTTLGFKGLKLQSQVHGHALNNYKLMDPIFELCEAYDIPIVAHGYADSAFTMPKNFEDMADRFPKVNLIMFHAGGMWSFYDAVEASRTRDNLFLGTSSVPTALLSDGVKKIGPEKFIFESDTPWYDYVMQVTKVLVSVERDADREAIMSGNLKRILRVGGRKQNFSGGRW